MTVVTHPPCHFVDLSSYGDFLRAQPRKLVASVDTQRKQYIFVWLRPNSMDTAWMLCFPTTRCRLCNLAMMDRFMLMQNNWSSHNLAKKQAVGDRAILVCHRTPCRILLVVLWRRFHPCRPPVMPVRSSWRKVKGPKPWECNTRKDSLKPLNFTTWL